MADLTLDAQPRSLTGRKVRQLRTQGLVPVVVYGNIAQPVNLQVPARALELMLHHGGMSQLVQVNVAGGGSHNVLVREVQRHPVNHSYVHVDFFAVNMQEKQEVNVPVVATGKPAALVTGMMVLQVLDSVELSALPSDIPAVIEVDVTGLDLETPILIENLPALPGVEYLGDPNEHVFSLLASRTAAEAEETAPEVSAVEPEVVTRAREDEDEG